MNILTPSRAYSYIRFSSAEQEKGRSRSRQYEQCRQYCLKHGLSLAQEDEYTFFDRGLSAYKADHIGVNGQLRRFLTLVKNGTIQPGSYLIVESLDRLSREHVREALPRFIDILNSGINIVTLTDERVYKSDYNDTDLIVSIFIMSRAHEESNTKAVRVGDAWRKKQELARAEKKPIGAAAPLWLLLTEAGYVLNPDRASVVRRIFDLCISGYGNTAIQKRLNEEGVASFRGVSWGASSVQKILVNRAVIGEYQPYSRRRGTRELNGEPISNYYPRVIDETTFYRASAVRNERKIGGATKQSNDFNLWQGVSKCSKCTAALHIVDKGRSPKGGRYLICANRRKGLCDAPSINLKGLDDVFKELLVRIDAAPLVQEASAVTSRKLAETDGRLIQEKQKLEQYALSLADKFSQTVATLAANSEQKISELEHQKITYSATLAAETTISKSDFFERLDVVTYEGRFRANALLKRIKINVYIGAQEFKVVTFIVVKEGKPIFTLHKTALNQIKFLPFSLQQLERAKTIDFDGSPESALNLMLMEYVVGGKQWDEDTFADKAITALQRAGVVIEDED